jgi:hypothetical protein
VSQEISTRSLPKKPPREVFSDAIHRHGRAENERISNALPGAKDSKRTGSSNPHRSSNEPLGTVVRCSLLDTLAQQTTVQGLSSVIFGRKVQPGRSITRREPPPKQLPRSPTTPKQGRRPKARSSGPRTVAILQNKPIQMSPAPSAAKFAELTPGWEKLKLCVILK